MLRKKTGEIEWLEFELLANRSEIFHAVFLRQGGVSKGPYASLNALTNLGGDDSRCVEENRRRMQSILNLSQVVYGKQVHGTHVECIHELSSDVLPCDGFITPRVDCGLLIVHADCQAALFYDPIQRIIANVHAGWRGQVKNIYRCTIEKMSSLFHSRPQDILVCISPSLGPQHSEFKHFHQEFPEDFWPFQIKPNYFNLWEIARYQLEAAGILPQNIEIAEMDTYDSPRDFFSYRREKAAGRLHQITGGHGTWIGLNCS